MIAPVEKFGSVTSPTVIPTGTHKGSMLSAKLTLWPYISAKYEATYISKIIMAKADGWKEITPKRYIQRLALAPSMVLPLSKAKNSSTHATKSPNRAKGLK